MAHLISTVEAQILQTAHVITWDVVDGTWIRSFHKTPEGAEILRAIVRDNLEGADKITAALWLLL